MLQDPSQQPPWAQFSQGFGYDPYGLAYNYGGMSPYAYGNPYSGFLSPQGFSQQQSTSVQPTTYETGSAGAYGAAAGLAAQAIPQWGERYTNALSMRIPQVQHVQTGLYQTAQVPNQPYTGPTVGSSLRNAGADALSGAATGAQIGTAIAPGIGTAIGAGLGAIGSAAGDLISAYRAPDMQRQYEQKLRAEQQDVAAHNALANIRNRRDMENQSMLNNYGPYSRQAYTY